MVLLSMIFIVLYAISTPKILPIKTTDRIEIYLDNGSHGQIKSVNLPEVQYSLAKKGQAYEYLEDVSIEEILRFYSAKVVFTESSYWGESIYAYSKNIKLSREINGKIVNIQISKSKNDKKTKIGFPIIYGSY